jgi:4-coumarate--CoA ligase (photoactive yellow protein activation family)
LNTNSSAILRLSESSLVPVIGALIADELLAMRQGQAGRGSDLFKNFQWLHSTALTLHHRSSNAEHEVVIDSLEWMAIASRVVTFFQMQQAGIEDYLLRVNTLGEWAEVVVKSRELGSSDICFSTSGSTGIPKNIVHTWRTLLAEIAFFSDYLKALPAPPSRIVALIPPHHIYGFLFTVMLPAELAVPSIRGLAGYAAVFSGRVERGDVVIAVPSLLHQLAQRKWYVPEGITVVCSGGPCSEITLQSLQQRGVATTVEVYGSSETSGIGVRTNPAAAYQLLPRWEMRSDSTLFDCIENREVCIPDIIKWDSQQHFRPSGRIDQAVSVNGVNVFPKHVAQQLMRHSKVLDARVRLLTADYSRGLKALLIVSAPLSEEEQQVIIAEVRTLAAQHLTVQEIPVRFTVATSIPVNPMGKEVDWD